MLNKKLNDLWTLAGTGGEIKNKEAQIDLLKVIYGQASHTYNTSVGSLLLQLATLTYIDASRISPVDFIIDPTKPTGPEFSVISQDTLLARRLMMREVVVPDLSPAFKEQATKYAEFTANISTEIAEKQQRLIAKLTADNEKLKRDVERLRPKTEGNATGDVDDQVPEEQVELVDDDIDNI